MGEELTPEQSVVVDAHAAARLVVIAGPGTGKTHTLVRRATALGEQEDLGRTVLALSFTRAVVAEIRERARSAGTPRVTASTIDAFAARCVLDRGEELVGGYEATIRRATQLLRDGQVPLDFEHILVDEIQDLVGVRGTFVAALLHAAGCGFTLFGDPAQAIFGHEADKGEASFLEQLGDIPDVETVALTIDHRSDQQLERPPRPGDPGALADHLRGAPRLTSLQQLALLARRGRGTLGVLTRTNGEALYLERCLRELGVHDIGIRQAAGTAAAPAWIARLVNDDVREAWTRRALEQALSGMDDMPDLLDAWRALRRLTGEGGDRVTLAGIRRGLRSPYRASADAMPTHRTVISTIHRAKGLEWDEVVVLAPRDDRLDPEEERLLYVAATRSRGNTRRLDRTDPDGVLRLSRGDRWCLTGWRGGLKGVECRFGDVRAESPASPSDDAATVQNRLAHEVRHDDEIEIVRREERFEVHHDDRPIGLMSDEFEAMLGSMTGIASVERLAGARVLCVRSVSGSPELSEEVGLPATGVWLCPEIHGLVDIVHGGRSDGSA